MRATPFLQFTESALSRSHASWRSSRCNKQDGRSWARVPFEPKSDRPVYCILAKQSLQ